MDKFMALLQLKIECNKNIKFVREERKPPAPSWPLYIILKNNASYLLHLKCWLTPKNTRYL